MGKGQGEKLPDQKKNKKNAGLLFLGVLAVGLFVGCALILAQLLRPDRKAEEQAKEEEKPQQETQVKLGKYKGIQVSLKVTQEDLDAEIENIREEHATYEKLSGTVADGDLVYAEFEGYVNGVKADITCGRDYVEVGSGEWVFENGLIGAVAGEDSSFVVTVPENYYQDPSVDGQDVEFRVRVEYICGKKILPKYNDDFVQSISKKYNTVKEYNAHLKKSIAADYQENRAEYVWPEVMVACKVKNYPEELLKEAEQEVLQGYYDMADIYGITREEAFVSFGYQGEEDFRENGLEELAEETAKEYLVAQAIAEAEGITYDDKDYQEVVEEEYSYVEENYDSQQSYEAANQKLLQQKTQVKVVKDWLAEHAEYVY